MSDYTIPFRFIRDDEPKEDKWCLVHCGFPGWSRTGGWGYHNAARQTYVWFNDVAEYLGFPLQQQYTQAQLIELAEMLRPYLAERNNQILERMRHRDFAFARLSTPAIRKPMPSLRGILAGT